MVSWDDFPVLTKEDDSYTHLPFSGWFLMLGWAAGPFHARRRPGSLNDILPSREILSGEDEEWLYEMANEYLAPLGIPPVPRGYAWFLARPAGIDSDEALWRRLNDTIDELGGLPGLDGEAYAAAAYPVVAEAIRRLY
ncbi:hypothetical protein LJ754_03825 [Arthrobacter sp. zg-Y40]|uniref:DUF5956 family protein n=1 Tax=Arthrobacter sp. zg-Y40 TaxID=2886939 RepID=UPI001D137D91|nr:DUF5956 family protein [Arthrobacter sp. zg-Y40]MCC3278287.1 hypothetical protein [Arthrobacter sp. zg-Y40]